jgi:hypothetical protein
MPRHKTAYWALGYKRRRFVDEFIACNFNGPEAASRTGYKNPHTLGHRLARNEDIRKAVDERLEGLRDTLRMEAEEVISHLTDIARDKLHKDRLGALDKLSRIHGLYNDKVAIETNRRELLDAIEQEIKRLTSSSIDVEAKVVEEKPLLPPKPPPTVES